LISRSWLRPLNILRHVLERQRGADDADDPARAVTQRTDDRGAQPDAAVAQRRVVLVVLGRAAVHDFTILGAEGLGLLLPWKIVVGLADQVGAAQTGLEETVVGVDVDTVAVLEEEVARNDR